MRRFTKRFANLAVFLAAAGVGTHLPVITFAADAPCRQIDGTAAAVAKPADLRRHSNFAIKLLLATSKDGTQNAAISPFGVETVLSELELAANTKLKAAISATLQLPTGDNAAVERLRRNARLLARIEGGSFVSADAFFVARAVSLKPDIQEMLEAEGKILVKSLDFGSAEDVASINRWVSEKTGGRIDNILEPDPSLSLAAINALHFKDCWRTPFDPALTETRPFYKVGGSREDRPMMMADLNRLPHARRGRFDAVELPYADGRFALTVLTTRDTPATPGAFEKALPLLWEPVLKPRDVRLRLPQFSTSADIDLIPSLSKLGLQKGLSSPGNLAKLADGLTLSMMRQKTFIKLDEKGTEAAAVTIAGATRSVEMSDRRLSLSFDKPFIYALRHRSTGAILMFGYVADPGAKT